MLGLLMEKQSVDKQVLQLREVEKLSIRQIARMLGIGRRRIKRILEGYPAKVIPKTSIL